MILNSPLKNVLLIPQKSTFEILDKKYVFVIDKDNIVRSRHISIAAELPHIYVIKDGLEETDRILLEGLRLVREGDEIHSEFVKPSLVLSQLDLYAE